MKILLFFLVILSGFELMTGKRILETELDRLKNHTGHA